MREVHIAIHRKFQTRRVAEDSTQLYGEATQHSMGLSVDGYTGISIRLRREGSHYYATCLSPATKPNNTLQKSQYGVKDKIQAGLRDFCKIILYKLNITLNFQFLMTHKFTLEVAKISFRQIRRLRHAQFPELLKRKAAQDSGCLAQAFRSGLCMLWRHFVGTATMVRALHP